MGGGLRQCGVITAAGLVALKDMRDNLKVDHEKAVYLAKKLTEIPGIKVMEDNLHINMVFFELPSSVNSTGLVNHLLEKGIKICDVEDGLMRFVTHYWISYKDIDFVIDTMKDYLNI